MTTWSNTFNIILYQNYYLRTLNLTRDALGLIANTSYQALYVSGDDQVFRGTLAVCTAAFALYKEYLAIDRVNVHLGRYADPLNLNTDGFF